jgi:predicted Zn-dependent protease
VTGALRVIQVLPLGQVAREDLAVVSAAIKSRFACRVEILPAAPLPAHAWHPTRAQYDSDAILEHLFDRLAVDVTRMIGITHVDLFAEGRNFVFGYAHMRDRVAVFSTLRLCERWWGRPDDATLLRSRIDKALTHEIGHTFHAPHCPRARCVMHQVEFLWQLDELDPNYCAACEQKVQSIARRGVDGPESLFELAGSYMRRRRFGRAAAAYAAAVERNPSNPHFWNDHGVALLALGDRAAAARSFRKAVELAPGFPHAWYNLGIVSRERGDQRAADYFFQEAVRRDEDPRAAYRYLATLHRDYFHDPERATVYLDRYHAVSALPPAHVGESTAPV